MATEDWLLTRQPQSGRCQLRLPATRLAHNSSREYHLKAFLCGRASECSAWPTLASSGRFRAVRRDLTLGQVPHRGPLHSDGRRSSIFRSIGRAGTMATATTAGRPAGTAASQRRVWPGPAWDADAAAAARPATSAAPTTAANSAHAPSVLFRRSPARTIWPTAVSHAARPHPARDANGPE